MSLHLSDPHSPSARLAHYRKVSEEAKEAAINAANPELTTGFLKLAIGWDELAEKARTELNTAAVPRLWG